MNDKFTKEIPSVSYLVAKENGDLKQFDDIEGITSSQHKKLKLAKHHQRRDREKDTVSICKRYFIYFLFIIAALCLIFILICIGDLFYKYFRDIVADSTRHSQAVFWIWHTGSSVSIAIGKFFL